MYLNDFTISYTEKYLFYWHVVRGNPNTNVKYYDIVTSFHHLLPYISSFGISDNSKIYQKVLDSFTTTILMVSGILPGIYFIFWITVMSFFFLAKNINESQSLSRHGTLEITTGFRPTMKDSLFTASNTFLEGGWVGVIWPCNVHKDRTGCVFYSSHFST